MTVRHVTMHGLAYVDDSDLVTLVHIDQIVTADNKEELEQDAELRAVNPDVFTQAMFAIGDRVIVEKPADDMANIGATFSRIWSDRWEGKLGNVISISTVGDVEFQPGRFISPEFLRKATALDERFQAGNRVVVADYERNEGEPELRLGTVRKVAIVYGMRDIERITVAYDRGGTWMYRASAVRHATDDETLFDLTHSHVKREREEPAASTGDIDDSPDSKLVKRE